MTGPVFHSPTPNPVNDYKKWLKNELNLRILLLSDQLTDDNNSQQIAGMCAGLRIAIKALDNEL